MMHDSGHPPAEKSGACRPPAAAVANPLMTEDFSVYLDLVRFFAALAVLVGHLDQDGMATGWLEIGHFGHEAVVIFFVLSGLVISHSAFGREQDWRAYVAARFARIYSVVLPAIVLSFAVKAIAVMMEPQGLGPVFFSKELAWGNLFGALFFLNESWSMGTALPWNDPFWSLCYEVWYYVIFGLALFVQGRRRWLWATAAALVAGPAILLLFPLWLLGSWLAAHGAKLVPCKGWSLVIWIGSILAIIGLDYTGVDIQIKGYLHDTIPGFWRLSASQGFVTDYLLGLLVAANFLAFRGLDDRAKLWLQACRKPVVFLAGYTFSLYLFHRPLSQFIGYFFPNSGQDKIIALGAILGVSLICLAIGALTEQRKQGYRRLAMRFLARIRPV